MLAIDIMRSLKEILEEKPGDYLLPKSALIEVLESYESELGEDELGDAANQARIEHFYQ